MWPSLIRFAMALLSCRSIDVRMYDLYPEATVPVYLTTDMEETCWEGRHLEGEAPSCFVLVHGWSVLVVCFGWSVLGGLFWCLFWLTLWWLRKSAADGACVLTF